MRYPSIKHTPYEEVQSNFHVSMYFVIMHQDRDASRQLAIIMYVKEILFDAGTEKLLSCLIAFLFK